MIIAYYKLYDEIKLERRFIYDLIFFNLLTVYFNLFIRLFGN